MPQRSDDPGNNIAPHLCLDGYRYYVSFVDDLHDIFSSILFARNQKL